MPLFLVVSVAGFKVKGFLLRWHLFLLSLTSTWSSIRVSPRKKTNQMLRQKSRTNSSNLERYQNEMVVNERSKWKWHNRVGRKQLMTLNRCMITSLFLCNLRVKVVPCSTRCLALQPSFYLPSSLTRMLFSFSLCFNDNVLFLLPISSITLLLTGCPLDSRTPCRPPVTCRPHTVVYTCTNHQETCARELVERWKSWANTSSFWKIALFSLNGHRSLRSHWIIRNDMN